jgi:hypothetical protein
MPGALVWAPKGECGAYEKISTTTSSIGFTAAKLEYKGKRAKAALITVEAAAIRFTMDGTTPVVTATSNGTGHLVDTGQSFIVEGYSSIVNFRCINAVADSGARVYCSFYF